MRGFLQPEAKMGFASPHLPNFTVSYFFFVCFDSVKDEQNF